MNMHPAVKKIVRAFSRLHGCLYRVAGGRGLLGRNTLVLTTRGRKTGREVATPLFYVEDGGRLYVVASFAGNDIAPHWYKNLVADPRVTVELQGERATYRARSLEPADAERVWPKLLAMYPPYADYQKRTNRVIPVVELSSGRVEKPKRQR